MSKRSRAFVFKLLGIGTLMLLLITSQAQAGALFTLDGQEKKVEDYLGDGKWTVVMFWASDCHVCHVKAKDYVAFQEKHKNARVRVLGLTLDGKANKAAAQAFIAEHKLNFPNLIGEPEAVSGYYYDKTGNYFVGTPTFMIFNPQGKVRAADAGAIPINIIEDFIREQDPGAL